MIPIRRIALALQGGGSHGAFTWGVLDRLLQEPFDIVGITGTSAGAMNAAVLTDGLRRGDAAEARKALGTMATISLFRAVAAIGSVRVAGFAAWALWLVVHHAALIGFGNRLSVVFNWTVALVGGGRAERVGTAQQAFGRHGIAAQAAVVPPEATRV